MFRVLGDIIHAQDELPYFYYKTSDGLSMLCIGDEWLRHSDIGVRSTKELVSDPDNKSMEYYQHNLQDKSVTRRARPATMDTIIELVASLNTNKINHELFIFAMALCYHDLLRAGELFTGIKVNDIDWNFRKKYFILPLSRSKTHRKGDPIEILITDRKGFSAYQTLLSWFW